MRDPEDDYFAKVQEARTLNAIRDQREAERCRTLDITPEMKEAATAEIATIQADMVEQTPEEQLRRYERMFELADVRGYFYTTDPAFDIIRMSVVRQYMEKLAAVIAAGGKPV